MFVRVNERERGGGGRERERERERERGGGRGGGERIIPGGSEHMYYTIKQYRCHITIK